MDLKNEVAAITFFVGIGAILLLLTGIPALLAGMLPFAVGSALPSQFAGGQIANTGSSMVTSGAVRTTLGVVGIVSVWAAIESGYFDPHDEREREPVRQDLLAIEDETGVHRCTSCRLSRA